MSSASIFVPGAFGITLKRPKEPPKTNVFVCGAASCKQQYDPDSASNKLFYATAVSNGKRPRRDLCPFHASNNDADSIADDSSSLASTATNTSFALREPIDTADTERFRETPFPTTLGFRSVKRSTTRELWTAGLRDRLKRVN